MKTLVLLLLTLPLLLAAEHRSLEASPADDAARVVMLINQARLTAGLAPLATSPILQAAAQTHSDDMGKHGVSIGHNGSDGSTPSRRIARAGYRPYSWGVFVGENWAAYQSVDLSVSAWMSDAVHRANVLHPAYREIGVGITYSSFGYPIVVADFGAQPGVLPIFMNGSGSTATVTLSNENAAPDGDGANVMGRAITVELSTASSFSGAATFPFATSIRFSSPDGAPISKVYARFHDAQGRTVVSAASASGPVVLPASVPASSTAAATVPLPATPRPSPTRTRTPRPTAIPTRRPSPTATATPTDTATLTPSPTSTPTQTLVLHQAAATAIPAVVQTTTMPDNPYFSTAQALFAAAAFVSLGALGAAWRMKRGMRS